MFFSYKQDNNEEIVAYEDHLCKIIYLFKKMNNSKKKNNKINNSKKIIINYLIKLL